MAMFDLSQNIYTIAPDDDIGAAAPDSVGVPDRRAQAAQFAHDVRLVGVGSRCPPHGAPLTRVRCMRWNNEKNTRLMPPSLGNRSGLHQSG